MHIEKLPSGSYRVTQMYKKKRYRVTFDHKPTQKEIALKMATVLEDTCENNSASFFKCVDEYIESKDNILSPTTIRSYKQIKSMFPDWLNMNINDITQTDIDNAINDYAKNHSAKSVKNYHGLISTVLKTYRPSFKLRTTLPKGAPKELTIPKHDEIVQILKATENTDMHIPIQLGCLGLRKGEILALKLSDLRGDVLTVNKTMVQDVNGSYRVKNLPKTVASVRKVVLPDSLAEEIRTQGYIYDKYPSTLLKKFHHVQDKLGIPRCRFHDLRHYFVSYAHSLGWSDADIIAITGHKTDEIAKRVYRHSMADKEEKKTLANQMLE